jgi:hypothetical protein
MYVPAMIIEDVRVIFLQGATVVSVLGKSCGCQDEISFCVEALELTRHEP